MPILRAAILIIATMLVLLAARLGAYSLYRVLQSPGSVKTETVSVSPSEIIGAQSEVTTLADPDQPKGNTEQMKAYRQFVTKYHQLFQKKFEPFRQAEDKRLEQGAFDDNFIDSKARLAAVAGGELDFQKDIADLELLHTAMSEAAVLPEAKKRLQAYKTARKTKVCRDVEKTRTTYESGWDRFSTSCNSWYEEPIGCSVTRPVTSTYTDRACSMQFPKGTQSHLQLFRAFQDRHSELLAQRRSDSEDQAAAKRQSIIEGIAAGKTGLGTALAISGAFIVLMFFFLLIAIERHQRRHEYLPTPPQPLPNE